MQRTQSNISDVIANFWKRHYRKITSNSQAIIAFFEILLIICFLFIRKYICYNNPKNENQKDKADFLEENFSEKIQNFIILPRRFGLKKGKIHLTGTPKCGKTSIALDFAKDFKKPVYIDCNDPRNDIEAIKNSLLKLHLEKKLDILIVDNFVPDFTLPNFENIILITPSIQNWVPSDFSHKQIYPLNFEEYISFDKKNLSISALFNHFLKDGNLPEIQYLNEYQKISRKQEINLLALGQHINFFKLIIPYQAHKITTNQIYVQLKKKIKISKDTSYELMQKLSIERIIYFLASTDINKPKKIYFYDFSLPYAFSFQKSFQAIFENMVFLELAPKNEHIFYDENCHFITQNDHAYICFPFPTQEAIRQKIEDIVTKKFTYSSITFITIEYECIEKIGQTKWRAISFINFALET